MSELNNSEYFFNRELSWLEFNKRVLNEALDERNPLLERVKFLGIFGSNLDEFFMVRVASLQQQVELNVAALTPDGRTPQQQLDEISESVHHSVSTAQDLLNTTLLPELEKQGVVVLRYDQLNDEQKQFLQTWYEYNIFPILTPLAVDLSHPFPRVSNLSLNFGVLLGDPETNQQCFARVKIPSNLNRFIKLPKDLYPVTKHKLVWAAVALEEVIAHNIGGLFPGMEVRECHMFRVTRDADLMVKEDEADDLMSAMEVELRKRRYAGEVVRLQIHPTMSANVREILYRGMKLDKNDIYETSGWLGLSSLMEIYALPLPDHKDKPWVPVQPKRLKSLSIDSEWQHHNFAVRNIFSIISEGDLIVHHPYESFADSVQNLIEKAAIDPSVEVIKITLYRTSGDSPIIQSLVKAAQAGKQVIALVELKARFDEASNIHWANLLEEDGVHVVYGIVGLKTHTKILLIVREEDGKLKRYTHVGTGNYNPKTAKLYTDIGLLSCNEKLGEDLNYLFNFLTGFAKQTPYHKLLVAPVTLRKGILDLIHRETEHSLMDRDAKIIAKMNSLVDPEIIEALYKASQAGVQIELIIRGICCLMPGIKGISENISVISIVGQYLEHSRIFYFLNHGNEDILIGSADWMPRNLDRRVEAVCYIEDSICKEELKKILEIQLADNCKAWELESTGDYHQRRPSDSEESRSSQSILMQYYKAKSDEI